MEMEEKGKEEEEQWNAETQRSSIPHDLMVEILLRTPCKSLLRFRCVCKLWDSIIKDPQFTYLHFQCRERKDEFHRPIMISHDWCFGRGIVHLNHIHSSPSNQLWELGELLITSLCEGFSMSSSINGLICLDETTSVIICNPIIGRYVSLPPCQCRLKLDLNLLYTSSKDFIGFGFHSSTRQYKVLHSLNLSRDFDIPEVYHEIFTLGSQSWRRLDGRDYRFHPDSNTMTYFDGALYFFGENNPRAQVIIVAFDVGDENFRRVQPPCKCGDDPFHMSMVELNGNLCLADNEVGVSGRVDIWVLKECMWIKKYSISFEVIGALSWEGFPILIRDGKIVFETMMLVEADNSRVLEFISYDIQNKKSTKIYLCPSGTSKVRDYVESLVWV